MRNWLYLVFGSALLLILSRGKGPKRISWIFFLKLSLALALLTGLALLSGVFFWNPSGRKDLEGAAFFLWAVLADSAMARIGSGQDEIEKGFFSVPLSFILLLGFGLWIHIQPIAPKPLLFGLCLPLGMALVFYLLAGLEERLQLAWIPRPVAGIPLLFWTASLLFLALSGVLTAWPPLALIPTVIRSAS